VEGSALATWTAGVTGIDDVEVRPRYLRYKPANKAILLHDVRLGTTWTCVVLTVAALRDLGKVERRDDAVELTARVRARCATSQPIAYLPELAALAEWYPAKLDMPGLARFEAAAELLPEPSATFYGQPQLMSYKPERRAVLRWGRAYLKAYVSEADHRRAWAGLGVGPRRADLHLARALADLPALRLTVQSEIVGRRAEIGDLAAIGAVVARLHNGATHALPPFTAADHLEAGCRTAGHLAAILPELAGDLDQLVNRLREHCPMSAGPVLSHGDLHLEQALMTKEDVGLVDLDSACSAAPAYDLATCAAHLVSGGGGLDQSQSGLDQLLDGYGRRPDHLEWYLAVAILRRAASPFRFLRPDWPGRVADMISAAGEAFVS